MQASKASRRSFFSTRNNHQLVHRLGHRLGHQLAQSLLLMALALFSYQATADTGQAFKTVGSGEFTSIKEHMQPGEWTVVMIWSDSCHVCNQEAGKYKAFHNKHAGKDANIIGLSLDGSQPTAQSFVDRHQLNYPNLVGDVRDVALMYQSETGEAFRATPTFMVYGPDGNLKAAQAGGVPPGIIEDFMAKSGS